MQAATKASAYNPAITASLMNRSQSTPGLVEPHAGHAMADHHSSTSRRSACLPSERTAPLQHVSYSTSYHELHLRPLSPSFPSSRSSHSSSTDRPKESLALPLSSSRAGAAPFTTRPSHIPSELRRAERPTARRQSLHHSGRPDADDNTQRSHASFSGGHPSASSGRTLSRRSDGSVNGLAHWSGETPASTPKLNQQQWEAGIGSRRIEMQHLGSD
ncbi:hypothetical protein BV898_17927 [Hypsibius exemplaris]|uniref:Uncharacterized protein n=1 Tax=Hypsibius exemplaris TaxID=2072580 RepID=A0A9X6NGJ7_HYPEX|nr:hypothetical protein BV898_17927 [Hypsibius exemplaris]